jgi:small conductance mechanosensitive channel
MPSVDAVPFTFRSLAIALALVWPAAAWSQEAPAPKAADSSQPDADEPPEKPSSAAERIAGIRRLLDSDRQRKTELEQAMTELDRDFEEASNQFSAADKQLTREKAQAKPEPDQSEAEREKALQAGEEARTKARDRFDAIIERRKAFQQQLDILKEKLAVAEEALQRATSSETQVAKPAAAAAEQPRQPPPPTAPAASRRPLDLAIPAAAAGEPSAGQTPPSDSAADSDHVIDQRVNEARKELAAKQAVLEQAEQDLKHRDRAIDVFQRDLESIRHLQALAQEELQTGNAAAATAAANLKQAEQRAAPQAELDPLREQLQAAQSDVQAAQSEVAKESARLTESERLLARMQEGRTEIARRIDEASSAVDAAKLQVQFFESPIAPHRLLRWVLRAGPRIVSILIAMFGFWWLSRVLAHRIVMTVLRRGLRGTVPEREGRAETLRRVFQSTASSAIAVLGILALLDQAGVNVTVLLGGAAVLGAAIAFGSQNLIKDYFSGFMILVENQYSVGNVVSIGSTAGVVEDITLRMTVLRDEEGVVHFLPHSQVTIVSNLTHGWSRAVFRIRVGYDQDVDRILAILQDLALELGREETYRGDLIGPPEMQGVDALDETAVIVKFLVKTRPLRQWAVKRELLGRIQRKFRELGIPIAYPQRIVQTRSPEEPTGR